eukprot:TRINITY_DN3572_c0_g3_i2.p1 TRINITY_DN3572_c0_g3~~TRINITY_DN3572_c0_g3_i2.p1  ORF type:complete len:858 (-),score=131.79 TRINITY_DN3572_c0_g3_i2:234-2807(-)
MFASTKDLMALSRAQNRAVFHESPNASKTSANGDAKTNNELKVSEKVASVKKQVKICGAILKQASQLVDIVTEDIWKNSPDKIREQIKLIRKTITLTHMSQSDLDPFVNIMLSLWQAVTQSVLNQINQSPHLDEYITVDIIAKRLQHQVGVDRIAIEELSIITRSESVFKYYYSVRDLLKKRISEYFTEFGINITPASFLLNTLAFSSESKLPKVMSSSTVSSMDTSSSDGKLPPHLIVDSTSEIVSRALAMAQHSSIELDNVDTYVGHFDIHSPVWISSILGSERLLHDISAQELSQKIIETIISSPEFAEVTSPVQGRTFSESTPFSTPSNLSFSHDSVTSTPESATVSRFQRFRPKLLPISPDNSGHLRRNTISRVQSEIKGRLEMAKLKCNQDLLLLKEAVLKSTEKCHLSPSLSLESRHEETGQQHENICSIFTSLLDLIDRLLGADTVLLATDPEFCANLLHEAQNLMDVKPSCDASHGKPTEGKPNPKIIDHCAFIIRYMVTLSQVSRLVESLSFDPSEFKSQQTDPNGHQTTDMDEINVETPDVPPRTPSSDQLVGLDASHTSVENDPRSNMFNSSLIQSSLRKGGELFKKVINFIRKPTDLQSASVDNLSGQLDETKISIDSPEVPFEEEKVICRICEEYISMSTIEYHSKFCAERRAAMRTLELCDSHLDKIIIAIKEKITEIKLEDSQSDENPPDLNIQLLSLLLKVSEHALLVTLKLSKESASETTTTTSLLGEVMKLKILEECKKYCPIVERVESVVSQKFKVINTLHKQGSLRAGKTRSPKIHDFQILKLIRGGGFGRVYLGRKRTTGDIYAIKMLKKEVLSPHSFRSRCLFSFTLHLYLGYS